MATYTPLSLYPRHSILTEHYHLSRYLTSTVFVTQVWESPYVSEADGKPDARENEFDLLSPLFALGRALDLQRLDHQRRLATGELLGRTLVNVD